MKGDTIESLVCEKLVWVGWGFVRLGGQAVLIGDALAGERVDVLVTKGKEDYLETRVTRVVTPSPDRVKPRCYHFDYCGGCD